MRRLILGVVTLAGLLVPAPSQATEPVRVGQEAPSFVLQDLFGRTISLDYFDQHPGVLLFWSLTRQGSAELLEDFRNYQERWGTQDLAIVAVNLDGEVPGTPAAKEVRDFAERRGIVFPVLLDPGQTTRAAYGITQVPTAVVIDGAGRVAHFAQGYPTTAREQLKGSLVLAMDGWRRDATTSPIARRPGFRSSQPDNRSAFAAACTIPRARSCANIHQRDPSASDASIMAVRLCNCYGDAEAAQLMLSGVDKGRLTGLDLRFALAHLMLVKGRAADARRAFEKLRAEHPSESWGEWGLSLVALAEGRMEEALEHLWAARAGGWSIPEAETAVLKYLEQYWQAGKPAPREEQFLALFAELGSVRACYRRLGSKG